MFNTMSSRNWHKWLVLPLLGLALSVRSIGCDYVSVTEKFGPEAVAKCNEKCPFQNRTTDGHFDVNCGYDCSVQQCKLGCNLWREGLENSCQTVCNVTTDTVFSRELYCVMGCNEALNGYFQMLRDLIGTPPAPALVADSLTSTSLSLVWEAPTLGNLSYLVQWRYEELPGTWQYYSNASHSDRSIIHVENLRPYTKYRFRVAVFLPGRGVTVGEPVYSAPSVVISTSGHGRPSSAPAALRCVAPDASRVAISWEPGPFPNGPLISYVLRLVDMKPNTNDALEEMPASNNTLFYMFQNLAPAREYEVSVSMRNAVGEGPRAHARISTPPLPTSVPSQQPVLILGGEHNVLAAPANDIFSDPIQLFTTSQLITGIGIDLSSDSLFVSVSNGFVYRSSLTKESVYEPILSPENISYKPLDLSVDWLNKHLYVLGEVYYNKEGNFRSNDSMFPNWEILRCDFDGKNQIVALSGFNTRPIHFEVDAYNGYLLWSLGGIVGGGLYRLDLANISNGVHHDVVPTQIVRDAHLGPFTVDHTDFRLLVTHLRRNTVLAVSLDGREVTDFRNNTQTPMFQSTRSITYANGLFYWTNGKETLTEEYHAQSNSYFHNEFPLAYNSKIVETRLVLVALRSCQPIPVPVNPPISVQSVMGISRAKVSWAAPHLLGHQGKGAWQQWMYHVQLVHSESGHVIDIKNITESFYNVENLKQDAEYVVKVAAVTVSGAGPWSSEFVGKTLASTPTTLHSTLLWSGPDGLLQTDLTGDNLQTLIHRSHLKNLQITDISWYQDKLYLVTNASTVLWYNTTTHEKGVMENMDNVGSLAVDWVGKKIYWSNPQQQLITRGNFDGTNREPVPIVTVAKELTIDSLEAYIYWNTGHAVESARLNGENKMVYYPAQLFSGKRVMGLAADLEKKWLYWLVRSYDGSELHRAPTADQISSGINEISGSLITRLSGTATLGPLCYFSARLVWVQDASRAVVSDLAGKYTAELVPRVHVIAVRDPTLHEGSESIIAIPEAVNASSIQVVGKWDKFNVTWSPSRKVNMNKSKVYYDISLEYGQHKIERTVSSPFVQVSSVPAYSALRVRVVAHSAWGSGAAAAARARSPAAPPPAPAQPALYTHRDSSTNAIFRWTAPSQSNGMVLGYEVQCWAEGAPPGRTPGRPDRPPALPSACAAASLPPGHTQLVLKHLIPNTMYFFKVRAYTEAGFGPYSEVVSVLSDETNPIPKVMISAQESLKIYDLDLGESEIIPKSAGIPIDFAVSIEENIVYWVNNLEEIFSSRINGTGHYKLMSINGSATSVCVDWVARSVYWSQLEMTSTEFYITYKAILGLGNAKPQVRRLFSRRQPIYNLQISPLRGSLFWYEESRHPGLGTLMTANLNGSHIRTFFNNTKNHSGCNCPENPLVSKSFVLDIRHYHNELYWVDPWVNHIVSSDINGCKCRVVVEVTDKNKYGFVPMSIAVDSKYIYWYNSTEKSFFYTTKHKRNAIRKEQAPYGYKIMGLDASNQPYPPRECLFLKTQILRPRATGSSANSLNLRLPVIGKPAACSDFEYDMPATEYTIYYRQQTHNDTTSCAKEICPFIVTTSPEVMLTELKPFTNYTVMVEATNYYAKLHEVKPIVGLMITVQTAAEAPTPPKNVSAIAISPILARVEWTPDPGLWYELHWRTEESSPSLPHKLKEHNTFEVSEGRSANMSRLSPNTLYKVWVRAKSKHSEVSADSSAMRLKTYDLPAPIVLKNATAYELKVDWQRPTSYKVQQFHIEYSEVATFPIDWQTCRQVDKGFVASSLSPKTRYRFRLRLLYVPDGPLFYWPNDDKFIFETLADVPAAPGALRVEALGDKLLRAWWTEPDARGASVSMYRLWGRPQHRAIDDNDNLTKNMSELLPADLPDDIDDDLKRRILTEGLELLHNGTEPYWLVSSESAPADFIGFVQACNARGCGALSAGAALAAGVAARPIAPTPLAAAALAAAAILAAIVTLYLCRYNRRNKKTVMESQITTIPRRGPDVELATLRQLPIRHSSNILYNQLNCPTDAELASLPHIRREQITLTKFLGSGAFGEVFEGQARELTSGDTKVAVKTLRKGATEQEKGEFLKEAALMSNFKHEHILRLLGVCLDNDPNYIIMELMEEGDLLSYLRAKRASLYTPESLTLLDLFNMCVDVTKGCCYLEEMHFVHRDLACRNCLVAHRGNTRIVKIGDFGLARDIYKNDYYRKEGEGLLPVRWMAVECLVDGVFSSQSDVWAWGVLCWEILSLGQQPYPARTNRQVLAHVRAGGQPERPPNCPSRLYELLQQCWSYYAERRPTFRECLEVVVMLRDKTSPRITLTHAASSTTYLALLPHDAVDNRTYLLDENHNAFIDEDLLEHEMEPSRMLPAQTPKYLELMYNSDSGSNSIDGYEVPRAPIAYMPFSRHSIVGVAPNRLIKPPLYRTHSLKTNTRPRNATVVPLRNGIVKRASLCDSALGNSFLDNSPCTSRERHLHETNVDSHNLKTML